MKDIVFAVNVLYSGAARMLPDVESLSDPEGLEAALTDIASTAAEFADRVTDGISYYCRLNAELAGPRAGFLYSRSTTDTSYRQIDTTDLSLYESGDSHIRWYELAADSDGPLWVEPYDSPIGNDLIISYEIPWRSADGTFIGVVGFDMSFSSLLRTLENVVSYESGFAGLVSADGTQLYITADGAVSVTAWWTASESSWQSPRRKRSAMSSSATSPSITPGKR